jgi:hypothetical protein
MKIFFIKMLKEYLIWINPSFNFVIYKIAREIDIINIPVTTPIIE